MNITPEIKARLEAAGHQAALLYVEELATQKAPVGHIELLEMHRRLFAQSWSEIAGRFRTENIEITGTSYLPPHWQHVPGLTYQALAALNDQIIQTQRTDLLRIAALAAQAHYDIVAIHPFRDGNGRIARCIMNYVFRYFNLPYVIIPVEARDRYLNALEAANQGNLQLLADLIIERYEHSLDQLLNQPFSSTSR